MAAASFGGIKRSIQSDIFKLAIPNILANISVPLISTVDTALMGQLSSTHLAAVGLSSMIFNFIYWNMGFLRMSTTGITAQAFGAKNDEGIRTTLWQGITMALLLAVILLACLTPMLWASKIALQIHADQWPYVAEYARIRIWDAPATFLMYAIMGWYFGMQNAWVPMLITIVTNLLNAGISAYLVMQLEWGIQGVAWGTVCAQYLGVLVAISILLFKYPQYARWQKENLLLSWQRLKSYLTVNADIFIRTLALTLSFLFFYRESSILGEQILAVNVILLQFVNWMAYAIDGFAFAAESLVGRFKGAMQKEKLKISIRYIFLWSGVFAACFTLAYGLWGEQLLGIFTKDVDLKATAMSYLYLLAIFPLFAFVSYIWDGIYIGLTASAAMRDAMLLALGVYLGSYFLIFQRYGNTGLWLALLTLLLSRALIQAVMFRKRDLVSG